MSVIGMCPGVPCVDKNTSGSEVLQDIFFDSCLRCRFSNFHLFRLSASKGFFERQVFFFWERDFRGFGEPNMSLKKWSFLKKKGTIIFQPLFFT